MPSTVNTGWPAGTLAGVPLRIRPSTLVVAALTLLVWTQAFDGIVPAEMGLAARVAFALSLYLGFLASLLAHEFAHVLAARRLGYGCESVTLTAFGMFAHIRPDWRTPGAEATVAAAGPILSFALAIAFLPLIEMDGLPGGLALVLHYVNLGLGVFNLVPCFPMDGGRLLRAIAWKVTGDVVRGTVIAARTGWAAGALIVAYGAYAISLGNPLGIVTILIALLMIAYARREVERLRNSILLDGTTAGSIMRPFGIVPGEISLTLGEPASHAEGEPAVVLWHQSRLETIGALPICTVASVRPDATLGDIMAAFTAPSRSGWPVLIVSDGTPRGFVTMEQVKGLIG